MVVALPALIVVLGSAAIFTTTRFIKSEDQFSWRLPSYVVTGASILLVSLVVYSPYSDFLYGLLIAPIVCLILLALLLASAMRKRPRRCPVVLTYTRHFSSCLMGHTQKPEHTPCLLSMAAVVAQLQG